MYTYTPHDDKQLQIFTLLSRLSTLSTLSPARWRSERAPCLVVDVVEERGAPHHPTSHRLVRASLNAYTHIHIRIYTNYDRPLHTTSASGSP